MHIVVMTGSARPKGTSALLAEPPDRCWPTAVIIWRI